MRSYRLVSPRIRKISGKSSRQEEFVPAYEGPATEALLVAIDKARRADASLSYGDAYALVGRQQPDLAAVYLAESRGPKPLPGGHDHGVPAVVWRAAAQLYRSMTPQQQSATIPPIVAQHWLSRWQPMYYIDERGALIGSGGDRLLGRQYGVVNREPAYAKGTLVRLAINLDWSAEDILRSLARLLKERPAALRHRHRRTRSDLADALRWYYEKQSGVPVKVLAANAAGRSRHGRRAAARGTGKAVDQAARRIRESIRWLESLFPPKETTS